MGSESQQPMILVKDSESVTIIPAGWAGRIVRASNVGPGVDKTHEQRVACRSASDAVDGGKEDGGAVTARLIPPLHTGSDGAGRNGQEEFHGQPPLVFNLVADGKPFVFIEGLIAGDIFVVFRVLGHQGALPQQGNVLDEPLFVGEGLDVGHELLSWDALERILDLGLEVACHVRVGYGAEAPPMLEMGPFDMAPTTPPLDMNPQDRPRGDVRVGAEFRLFGRHGGKWAGLIYPDPGNTDFTKREE